MKTVLMEEMTWPQLQRAIGDGYTTAIVVAGSIEQHGKHLPVGTDTVLGYAMAEHLATALGNALVAPVIRPGCSDHHMSFPGSLTIPRDLFKEVIKAYCRNLWHHGFERILLMTSHGGNRRAIKEVEAELAIQVPKGCRLILLEDDDHTRYQQVMKEVLARFGVTLEQGGSHSGFVETSLMMTTRAGEYVDMPAAEAGFVGDSSAKIQEVTKDGRWNIKDISAIGVLGDPANSSPEAGKAIMEGLLPVSLELLRKRSG